MFLQLTFLVLLMWRKTTLSVRLLYCSKYLAPTPRNLLRQTYRPPSLSWTESWIKVYQLRILFIYSYKQTIPRDIEWSHLFSVLQTPSKSFRHCSSTRVMWGMLWEVKSIWGIFKSSYGEKLFLHICKLEWFKSKQTWVDGNIFICSLHKDLKGSLTRGNLQGKMIMKKTWSWKSRVRLPLKGCKFKQRPRNAIMCTWGVSMLLQGTLPYIIFSLWHC